MLCEINKEMSKNPVNYGPSNGPVAGDVKFAGNDSKDKMYEPKHKKKLVRVLTVVAYVFSVSLAAIMLSLFYVFIYNPDKSGGRYGSMMTRDQNRSNLSPDERFLHKNIEDGSNNTEEEPLALPSKTIQSSSTQEKIQLLTISDGNEKWENKIERKREISDTRKKSKVLLSVLTNF